MREDRRLHFSGMLVMDKDTPPSAPTRPIANTAGSRWYITVAPQESRNKNYTVFGRVLDGQDIVDQIRRNDEVIKVTVSNLRDKSYEPSTMNDSVEDTAEETATSTDAAPPAAVEAQPPSPSQEG